MSNYRRIMYEDRCQIYALSNRGAADELFYGGQAGGGKTDLGLGLALTAHKRSLILRRIHKDAVKLVERVAEILGNRDGYNGQLQRWKLGHRVIEFAGCDHEDDKQRFKGDPHDRVLRTTAAHHRVSRRPKPIASPGNWRRKGKGARHSVR